MSETSSAPKSSSPQRPAKLLEATGITYFPIALIARLPFAMIVVGVLTLVVSARGSVALGGLNSAATGLGIALCGPLIGAAADRWGQRPVLLATAVVNSTILLAMTWVVYSDLPDWVVLITAFLIGASAPQVSPLSRSRLVGVITRYLPVERRGQTLNATMAYESAADEVVFVFGPFIVGILATALQPAAPVIAAAIIAFLFVIAFALHHTGSRNATAHRSTDTSGHPVVARAPARELLRLPLVITTLGVLGVGIFFGAMLTSLTALMSEQGQATEAGQMYGLMGISSAVLALGVAVMPTGFSLRARWLSCAAVLLFGTVWYASTRDIFWVGVVLLVTGIGVGPTLVTQYSLGATRSPHGRSATTMTVLGSAIVMGQAFSAAVTGYIADAAGTQAAQLAPIVGATLVAVSGIANWVLSNRQPGTKPSRAMQRVDDNSS